MRNFSISLKLSFLQFKGMSGDMMSGGMRPLTSGVAHPYPSVGGSVPGQPLSHPPGGNLMLDGRATMDLRGMRFPPPHMFQSLAGGGGQRPTLRMGGPPQQLLQADGQPLLQHRMMIGPSGGFTAGGGQQAVSGGGPQSMQTKLLQDQPLLLEDLLEQVLSEPPLGFFFLKKYLC